MSRPATSRMKVNPPLGMRPSLENRRLRELQVDPAYQRSIDTGPSQSLIRKIAMFWDWALFQPLVVSRRQDGTFWVVDGQHRLAAALLRQDIWDLPCVVTAYDNPGDEAAAFVALNVQRRALNRMDLFKAALTAEDDVAGEVMALITSAGLSLAPHSNWTAWKPGMISNIGGILGYHKRNGKRLTGIALQVLGRAFEGEVLRYGGTIFGGIGGIISLELDNKGGGDLSIDLLVAVLQGATQEDWMKDIAAARGANPNMKWDAAATFAIGNAYREAAGEE